VAWAAVAKQIPNARIERIRDFIFLGIWSILNYTKLTRTDHMMFIVKCFLVGVLLAIFLPLLPLALVVLVPLLLWPRRAS
jgi:hypothetical protein